MDLRKDKELFYIAREGLKAPLPEVWKPAKNKKGEIYYLNVETKKTQWEHPCDEHYKKVYQEAFKKKDKKDTAQKSMIASKFKSNLPIGGGLGMKFGGLPLIQETPGEYNKREDDSFDNNDDNLLKNQDSDLDIAPIHKRNDKEVETPKQTSPINFTPLLSDLKENSAHELEEVNKLSAEYENKLKAYKLEKDKELKSIANHNNEAENILNNKKKQELARECETLKEKLIQSVQINSKSLADKKKKLKIKLMNEYENKTNSELKQIEKEHINIKHKLDINESRDFDNNIQKEEEKIIKNLESKIMVVNLFF